MKELTTALITGSSRGIGRAAAVKYLNEGLKVYGIDILQGSIDHPLYSHFVADVTKPETLPDIHGVNLVFVCAGVQNSGNDIAVNLEGTINAAEKYAFTPSIRSLLFCASSSARSGFEFPRYAASKAGVVGYMKNAAIRLAKFGATCNSISPGGVTTDLNRPVMDDPALWERIMAVTPLKKWATPDEISEWVWFLTMVNRSATGQDFLIDNGELDLNSTFVWPE